MPTKNAHYQCLTALDKVPDAPGIGQRDSTARHSSSSYISRLPDEILLMIFLCRRDDDRSAWHNGTAIRWLHVTAVCGRWRRICLATPSLWSHIDLGFNKRANNFADALLQRSKTAPLTLNVALTPTKDGQTGKKFFLDVMSRRTISQVRLLMGALDIATICDVLDRRSSVCAPYLRSLAFRGGRHPESPTDFLWPEMPALRELFIDSIALPLEFPCLQNLQSLRITLPYPISMTAVQVLGILQAAPLIKDAFLYHLSSDASDTSEAPAIRDFPRVELPHLKSLVLLLNSFEPLRCFDRLTFPSTTTITLSLLDRNFVDEESMESSILPNLLKSLSATGFKSAKFNSAVPRLRAKTIELSDNLQSSAPRLTIHELNFDLFHPLIPALGLEHVTFDRVNDWGDSIPYINDIKSLSLVDCRLRVLDTLKPAAESDDSSFPNLEKLTLHGYKFSGGKRQARAKRNEHHKLLTFLQSRAVAVRIEGGSATTAIQKYLSKLGERIEWVDVDLGGK
ncbi:hypothetical protein ONZ45_g12121 [Pleurotus djamor]|nr:hypothetical protein ONZ45_g12121 [Pleurotus djamor]